MDISKLNERKLEHDVLNNDEMIKKSEFYKEKGNELFKKSMFDEALDYYFKSITLNPKDHRCYGNIGQILINKERYSEAKEVLEAAIELNSNYVKAFYRLGLVEKHLKNYDKALQNFDQVLKLEPNNKATIKECEEIQKLIGWTKIETRQNVKRALIDQIQGPVKEFNNCNLNKKSISSISTLSIKSNSTNKSSIKTSNLTFPKIQIPFKLPDSLPKTSYQFNVFWKEIKDESQKIEYLTCVGAKKFQEMFQKNLEPDFLSELIVLFASMDKSLVLEFLTVITKIDNFDIGLMFLSKSEKHTLKQLVISLNANHLITL